jgi:glycosyltransferase involved in cell wall biosynthesis
VHVAILGPAHPWRGGIAHHSASLYRAFERAGHRVTLFNYRRLYPELLFPGKTQLDESDLHMAVPNERVYDPLDPRSWVSLGRRVRREGIERLVIQWWHPFFAPGCAALALLARRGGCEVVMMCHNVEPHEATPIDRVLLRLAYAAPDRFVVQSGAQRDRMIELVGRGRPVAIAAHPPYGIFAESGASHSREEARRHYGVEAEHLLVFFGLVRPYKGVGLLLEALAAVGERLDCELIIAGEVYGSGQPYRRRIAKLGLHDRVRLEDRYIPNEEVPLLFSAADVCILPYRSATGSGAANVAIACGVPLVMSRLATLEQAFAHEPVTWFEPDDAEALAEAIVAALSRRQPAGVASDADRWQDLVDALIGQQPAAGARDSSTFSKDAR